MPLPRRSSWDDSDVTAPAALPVPELSLLSKVLAVHVLPGTREARSSTDDGEEHPFMLKK
jgi:hypothetical protein